MIFVWLGLLLVGIWVVFGVFSSRRKVLPPGPPMSLFEKLCTLWRITKVGKFPHTLEVWHQEYGKILYFGVNCGPIFKSLMYSVSDPLVAQDVLRKTSIFPARLKGGLTYFLPKSLLGIHDNNQMWKKHRTILSKAFTDKYLKQYSEEILAISKELIIELEAPGNQVIQNINTKLSKLTYRIVACTVLGKDFYSAYPTVGSKSQLDAILKSVIMMSLLPPFLRGLASWASNSIGIANKHIFSQKEQILNDIINIRQHSIQGNSMLHFLVHHSAELSNDEIIDELLAFIMAGHETTANALSFALVCLSCNADMQRKARQEIESVSQGEPLTFSMLEKLFYVRAIFKETLRLFPVVPLVSRVPTQTTTIGPYTVDPQDKIIVNVYQMCRDADIFPDPLEFLPERWLPGGANSAEGLKSYDSTRNFGGGLRVRQTTCL